MVPRLWPYEADNARFCKKARKTPSKVLGCSLADSQLLEDWLFVVGCLGHVVGKQLLQRPRSDRALREGA